MELRGFSDHNGNYIVFSLTIHAKYELSLTGACRGKSVHSFYLAMGTLTRIRNVCFSYKKSGVVSFSQDIEWKKVSYMVFSGIILKKTWSYEIFPGVILEKWRYLIIPENVEKNGVIAFFLVLL